MLNKLFEVSGSKFMEAITHSMGARGHFTIPKSQLIQLAKADESGATQKILSELQNPNLEVAYKAQSNYSIAGIHLRDGEKSVARGSISVVNPGEEALVKARVSVGENGEIIQANGFVDASKYASINDSSMSVSRKDGVMTLNARSGDAIGENLIVNTEKASEIAKIFPKGEEAVVSFNEGLSSVATALDRTMKKFKDSLARKVSKPCTIEKCKPREFIEKADFGPKAACSEPSSYASCGSKGPMMAPIEEQIRAGSKVPHGCRSHNEDKFSGKTNFNGFKKY